jgi:hypothetical protein
MQLMALFILHNGQRIAAALCLDRYLVSHSHSKPYPAINAFDTRSLGGAMQINNPNRSIVKN